MDTNRIADDNILFGVGWSLPWQIRKRFSSLAIRATFLSVSFENILMLPHDESSTSCCLKSDKLMQVKFATSQVSMIFYLLSFLSFLMLLMLFMLLLCCIFKHSLQPNAHAFAPHNFRAWIGKYNLFFLVHYYFYFVLHFYNGTNKGFAAIFVVVFLNYFFFRHRSAEWTTWTTKNSLHGREQCTATTKIYTFLLLIITSTSLLETRAHIMHYKNSSTAVYHI